MLFYSGIMHATHAQRTLAPPETDRSLARVSSIIKLTKVESYGSTCEHVMHPRAMQALAGSELRYLYSYSLF